MPADVVWGIKVNYMKIYNYLAEWENNLMPTFRFFWGHYIFV